MKSNQWGATLTEFITIGPLIFLLGMIGLQYTLMYNAKTNLTYASYEAARAGAIGNASPAQIELGLLKGFLPYLSANSGSSGSLADNIKLLTQVKASEAPFMKIEIINPTAEAFDDFNSSTLQQTLGTKRQVIPNKRVDIDNLKSTQGSRSGVSIEEANVLKLRITYGYKPSIPIASNILTSVTGFLDRAQDPFSTMLFAADRIPIVVDVTAQMLSPAIQNELKTVGYNPGNTSDVIAGEHELPDLSDIDLPEKYEDLSRDEILDDIMANGGNKTDDRISNQDWLKLLIALGVITIGESQMDNDNNGTTGGNTAGSNNGFDINNNLNPNTDLVSDFQNQNMCTAGFTPNGRGNITAFESPDPFGSSLAPAAGPVVIGGAEIAAGGAILGGAACAANEYCPEAIGNILTSAGEGVQNAVEGMLGIFSSDELTKSQIKQKAMERKAYKSRCTEPTPPHLTGCERLKWELERNKDCRDMRENFSKKWFGDDDPTHLQEIRNLDVSINRLEQRIERECNN